MEEDGGELPDHLRCGRTDGRQWRCSRRAMGDRRLCAAHLLQARHRQYKRKVPESLKIQRKPKRDTKLRNQEDSLGHHLRQERVLAKISKRVKSGRSIELIEKVLGEALVIGKKRKLGGLLLELMRVFLRREIEKKVKKGKKKMRLESGLCAEEVMLDLPNGVMSISPPPPVPVQSFRNAGSVCDWKLGLSSDSLMRGRIRSKNIEPIQFGSCKVFPYGRNAAGLKKVGKENCIKDCLGTQICQKQL